MTRLPAASSMVAARTQRARWRHGAQRAQGARAQRPRRRGLRELNGRGAAGCALSDGAGLSAERSEPPRPSTPAPPAARRCAAIGRATTGGAAAAASSKPSAGTGVQNLGPPPDSARRPEVLRRTDCVMSVALAKTALLASLPSCENLGLPPGSNFFFFF